MPARMADAARCLWALLYWNVRKSLYVLRRRRGHCPCQNPSDIGARGGIRCDAAAWLREPSRFRRVCPYVVAGPGGRGAYCGVPASRVRPFWGRAVGVYAAILLGVYTGGALAGFAVLRATGLEAVSFADVAWPGSWHRIRQERSMYFYGQALVSYARSDYAQAYRSMVSAVAADPANYQARLFAAQYALYAGDALASERLFGLMMRDFPGEAARTAITRHDTLLATARYEELALHCLRMADEDVRARSVWCGSLGLAMRLGRLGRGFMDAHRDAFARLGPEAEALTRASAAVADDDGEAVMSALRTIFPAGADGNYAIQQIQLLLEVGAPANAEMAWSVNARNLDEFDRLLARCWVDAGRGDRILANLEFAALADRAESPAEWDKLAATLVMQPDREAFDVLHNRALRDPAGDSGGRAVLLWIAALATDSGPAREYWAGQLADRFRIRPPPVRSIDFFSADATRAGTVPNLAGRLPVGRITLAALYARMKPVPAQAAGVR